MPNWVKTNLKFVGSEEDIQNIKNLVITKDEAFWKQHKIFNPKR